MKQRFDGPGSRNVLAATNPILSLMLSLSAALSTGVIMTTGALLLGGDPKRPVLALPYQSQGLRIGRVDLVMGEQPHPRSGRSGIQLYHLSR